MVVCPCPGAIYMFEIVKKCQISLPTQDEVAGERYRTVGPLVKTYGMGHTVLQGEQNKMQQPKVMFKSSVFDTEIFSVYNAPVIGNHAPHSLEKAGTLTFIQHSPPKSPAQRVQAKIP